MKSKQITNYLLAIILILWSILFAIRVHATTFEHDFLFIVEVCEFILDIAKIAFMWIIYKKIEEQNKRLFKYLLIAFVAQLLIDISWYSLSVLSHPIVKIASIINVISFMLWSLSLILFTVGVLKKCVLRPKARVQQIIFFLLVNIVLIWLFSDQLHSKINLPVIKTHLIFSFFHVGILIHILEFGIRQIVINLALICLMYSESDGLILFLMGVIPSLTSYSLIAYEGILSEAMFNVYADMTWILGAILQTFGILLIIAENEYDFKKWIVKDSAVRSHILFFSFFVYTLIFGLLFILFHFLSIISLSQLLALPVFYSIYMPVIMYAFIQFSRYIERPFKHITKNIENLLRADDTKNLNEFKIDEFIFLQDFINDAFAYKNKANQIMLNLENEKLEAVKEEKEKFKLIIGQLIHDMASPLESIKNFSGKSENKITESDCIYMKGAATKLSILVRNLLSRYQNKQVDENKQENLLIIPELKQIMEEKELEYKDTEITFKLDVLEKDYFSAILINHSMFYRMISNLVNNAVDATKDISSRAVILKARALEDSVTIFVKDNGFGMTQEVQDKFLQGLSITQGKDSGHGLGLTQVYDTIKSVDAKLSIYARANEGTEIVLKFSKVNPPNWIINQINIREDWKILILDNDLIIHEKWKKKLETIVQQYQNIKVFYFRHSREILSYVDALDLKDIDKHILLADYDLGEELNGLEIIKACGIRNAILITSYANDEDLQNKVIQVGIKMLPKGFISVVEIHVKKIIEMFSKKVDMLWLDDQEFFVQSIISESYSDLKIETYTDPIIFFQEVVYYRLDTKIILDMYYESSNETLHKKTGLEIAEYLTDLGYTKITILTGSELSFSVPKNVRVILKTDREVLKRL